MGEGIRIEKSKLTNCRREEERKIKMIYRKWSLLTGPTAILAGAMVSVIVANFVFVENGPFLKSEQKKNDGPFSSRQ
ncbi:hypothetical protein SAY86_019699 [Trapa natans]|uniref:Uncharacterized protein n=1 Tax=Trapa natans TaxID=22666 RepID=A0AAN7LZA0_TRANT|nr:hypothetical protein SAY86_019699 [Trapa natans]